jgi:hypothetical protein
MNCNLKIYNETDFKKNRLSELLPLFNNLENIKFYLPFEMIEKIINAEFDTMENEAKKKIKIKFEFFDYYKISFRNLFYNSKMKFFHYSKYDKKIIKDKEKLNDKYRELAEIKIYTEDSDNEDLDNEEIKNIEDIKYLKKWRFENFKNQLFNNFWLNFYIDGNEDLYKEEINFKKVYEKLIMDIEALNKLNKFIDLKNGVDEKFKSSVCVSHYMNHILKQNNYNILDEKENNKNNLLLLNRFYKFYIDYEDGNFKDIKFIYNYIKSVINKLKELVDLMKIKNIRKLKHKYKRIFTDEKYFNYGGYDIFEEYKYILGWKNQPLDRLDFFKDISKPHYYTKERIYNFINKKYFINDLYDNFEEIEHNENNYMYRKFNYNDSRYFHTIENFEIYQHPMIKAGDIKDYNNDFNIYNETHFKNLEWLNIINDILQNSTEDENKIYDYQYYNDDYREREGFENKMIVDKIYFKSLKEHIKIKLKNNIDKNKNHIII